MKSFLTTTKGKAIAGIGTLAVIGIIVAIILLANSGYRTIAVEELNGTTTVTNSGVSSDAYIGQHLKSGDDVSVKTQSDMTMALDTDKYVYAKENTHFWIEAQGKKKDTRTKITLAEGSTLSRIDNKLASNESFEVETPNATMSVRGTVFKVESYTDSVSDTYTVIDVFEGAVFVQVHEETGANTEESRVLNAGERAIVRSNDTISEFIKSEDGDDEIEYSELTQAEALFLGKAIDEGRNLSIGKELLYDIVELTPHDFSKKGEEVEATCAEDGYYYEICTVCGAKGEKCVIPALGHSAPADSEDNICTVCGEEMDDEIAEETKDEEEDEEDDNPCEDGHKFKTKTVAATCVADGYIEDVCSVCKAKENHVDIPATGHNFVYSKVEPTCDVDGYESNICSVCGEGTTTKLPLLGHDFVAEHTDPTCTSEGMDSVICRRCGAGSVTTIPAKGHSQGSVVQNGLSGHIYVCGNCGQNIRSEGHIIGGSGACDVCGFK